MQYTQPAAHEITARDWASILSGYREPSPRRSVFELALTACAFVLTWIVMWGTLGVCYWLTLLMAVPAAGFLVRLFMIRSISPARNSAMTSRGERSMA